MATAYASLVSLMNVLTRIQHPSCAALFDQLLVQTMFNKVSVMIDFLEGDDKLRTSKLAKGLAGRMVDVSQEAGDLIQSYLADHIQPESSLHDQISSGFIKTYFHKAIQGMDLIIEDIMKLQNQRYQSENDDHLVMLSEPIGSVIPCSHKNTLVGIDKDVTDLLDKLTSHQPSRQIIALVGMGGIGKTALATTLYDHPLVVNHFIVRSWVTISEDYSVRNVLLCLLRAIGHDLEKNNNMDDEKLGETLYKFLFGRKYIIVLDDIWCIQAWDEIRRFMPDNNNGSRILLSTRLMNVVIDVGQCIIYRMKFLDENQSWNLLCDKVFGKYECPLELEKYGKIISRNCKGLPLVIVAIGGILFSHNKTLEYWEYIATNVTSIMNRNKNDENCLEILSLSYHHLPIHLKPCFLYMIQFLVNGQIYVTRLVQKLIANGFIKLHVKKTMEEVALGYLKDLVDRNIIMVKKTGARGNIKWCNVHDLFVDIGRREALEERMLFILKVGLLTHHKGLKSKGRIDTFNATYNVCPSVPITQSVALSFKSDSHIQPNFINELKLLHELSTYCEDPVQIVFQLSNARYLHANGCLLDHNSRLIPKAISLLWNLETFIVEASSSHITQILPSEIWHLANLRHLVFTGMVILPGPMGNQFHFGLNSLQTLSMIKNFNVTDEVVERIPNLVKLGVCYDMHKVLDKEVLRCLKNLAHLHKLETLKCIFKHCAGIRKFVLNEHVWPTTLRKLTLSGSRIPWENMSTIGSLPILEVLKLLHDAFCGGEWNSKDGEFQQLKFLSIETCDLATWYADSSHFPQLKHLHLGFLILNEIPSVLGEVDTLESIELEYCEVSAIHSAKKIVEEQKSYGNNNILVQVTPYPWNYSSEVMGMADDSFQIRHPTSGLSSCKKWCRMQALRMYHVFREAPVVLAPGDAKLENIILDISDDLTRVLLPRCTILEITPDDVIRHGGSIIDGIIDMVLFRLELQMTKQIQESNYESSPNYPNNQIIQYMKEKTKLNIENQIRSATNV